MPILREGEQVMTDYTPTTEEVLRGFANNKVISELGCARFEEMLNDGLVMELANEYGQPYLTAARRWLTEHDRQVAELAWDEGDNVGYRRGYIEGTDWRDDEPEVPNPYREETE